VSRKSSIESLVAGLVIAAGSLTFWFFNRDKTWLWFIFFFGGVLPLARGLRGVISERMQGPKLRLREEQTRAAEHERTILRLAADSGGRVTPALASLNTSMTLEEAEKALDAMTKKGHASMTVRDDGRVEYEFSEFLPMNGPRG